MLFYSFLNRSLLKKLIKKICAHTLTNIGFIFKTDFAWTTPKKYDEHPYHPNTGSTPSPPLPTGIWFEMGV